MSNELKYVLLPTIDRPRPPKFQPWYRERIKMKYPCNMNTRNWKFVKDGLDDFRDGLPPSHDDIILEPEKGPGPILLSENRRIKASVPNAQTRLKDHQLYFSKEIPAAEKRRETIDNYISTLLDHPMAFFSHFNDAISPELYEQVTKLLEAELLRSNSEDHILNTEETKDDLGPLPVDLIQRSETTTSEKSLRQAEQTPVNETSDDLIIEQIELSNQPIEESESKVSSTRPGRSGLVYDEAGNQWDAEEFERKQKNPYRWFIEKQREKLKAKGPTQDEQAAAAMEARLRDVSEQFCNWLHGLGGESKADVDSAVVRNLFSTAYDTKPSLSVPIKIVETARIPVELREGTQDTMIAQRDRSKRISSESRMRSSSAKPREISTAPVKRQTSAQRYRFGAWYLPKHLWQRALTTDELQDPKVIKAEREDVTRKREEEINARLAPLHGVNAFKEYLQERNIRRIPRLINDVEQYRRDHPREITDSTAELQPKRATSSTLSNK